MADDFDPYTAVPRSAVPKRPDPFRLMSRDVWPAKTGRHSRPARPRPTPSERELPAPGEASNERGIWEERSPFLGTRQFAVVADNGERIASVVALTGIVDYAFIAGLERLLERYRPPQTLKVI